jgi:hypothetical protein
MDHYREVVNNTDKGTEVICERNLSQFYFVRPEFNTAWPGIETGSQSTDSLDNDTGFVSIVYQFSYQWLFVSSRKFQTTEENS